MNICFFSGVITDVYKFKFIYNQSIKYKCIVNVKLQMGKYHELELIAFDEMIEKVVKNKFKHVHICAKFVENCRIQITDIEHY